MQHNFVFQLTFYPFQDKINSYYWKCSKVSDTVQIHSRHGSYSDTYLDFKSRYNIDTLQTRMPFWHLFRFQVQIRSRYRCHFDTYSDFKFRYSSDTLQKRLPFWCSFKIQIQFRYTPDPDAILIFIQIFNSRYSSDTFKTQTLFWCSFF